MRSLNGSARALVDAVSGEISREIYVNEDIYREEQERLFARAWLYIGHEDQVRNPGDYCLTKMGEESVILTRDRAGQVHVFLNSCRHRGMKVCRYDDGNTRAFICPYHAWTYDLDGRLIGVQDYENSYRPPFDRAKWGLVEVAQLANLPRHDLGDLGQGRAVLRRFPRRGEVRAGIGPAALGTAATARPSFWAAPRNGSCPATGNSSPRISPATRFTW